MCDHIIVCHILTFKCVQTVKINFGKTLLPDSNTSTQGKILSRPVENFYFKISTTNTTL